MIFGGNINKPFANEAKMWKNETSKWPFKWQKNTLKKFLKKV